MNADLATAEPLDFERTFAENAPFVWRALRRLGVRRPSSVVPRSACSCSIRDHRRSFLVPMLVLMLHPQNDMA